MATCRGSLKVAVKKFINFVIANNFAEIQSFFIA